MEIFEHATTGICSWDVPTLILLVAMIAIFFVRRNRLEKEIKELKEQLPEK